MAAICLSLNVLISFQVSNQQYSSIGSYNGLAPARQQALIGTNYG